MNHIKKHIIWLESQEFKNEYGGVEYLVDIHTQTLGENTTTHNGVTTFPNHIGRFGADCHDLDSRFTDSLIDTYTYPFYPPLLEPANTDYSTIDSKIALELRLPPKMVGGGGRISSCLCVIAYQVALHCNNFLSDAIYTHAHMMIS
ncbi:hypothetical protein LS81_009065 [Helicobacter trogontum]|uniref:Uncharacterized protein n=1 Tax=Helicobacter trogontum TaxID=50960 RepID=A0A4U8S5K9_9HELI|nr:hypothetical protein [Helicobacter trogontum]TLD81110.1 hypothetical protein LS81_009065 [Helicobacter trogontum]